MEPKSIIHNCDCMEFMRTVPDKHFALAIVDPPYGIGADKPSVKPNLCKQKKTAHFYELTLQITERRIGT